MTELSLKPCWPHSHAGSFYSTVVPSNPATIHTVVKHDNALVPWAVHLVPMKPILLAWWILFRWSSFSFFVRVSSLELSALINYFVCFHLCLILNRRIHIFSTSAGLICSSRMIKGWLGLSISSSLVGI